LFWGRNGSEEWTTTVHFDYWRTSIHLKSCCLGCSRSTRKH
jgi:hypothetical protein